MFQFGKSKESGKRVEQLPTELLRPNPRQPRRRFQEEAIVRLGDSIRRHGILQPLCVRKTEGAESYEIIAGERRWRAACLIGMERVPCLILEGVTDALSAQFAIVENLQREDLNCFEQAEAMEKLMQKEGFSSEQVGALLSLSPSAVSNKLRLLRLPFPQRAVILESGLSERHARAALRVGNDRHRGELLAFAGRRELSVREWEALLEEYFREPEGCLSSLQEPEEKQPSPRPVRRFVIKDVRIFINSVDKAVKLIRESGIAVSADKTEAEDYVEYSIRVPKVTA